MRSLLLILVSPVLFAGMAVAQQPDTVRPEPPKRHQEMKQERQALKGFVDEDGDGIDDRLQRQGREGAMEQKRQRMRDHFMDADGDGINDARCNAGLGFQRQHKGGMQRRGGKN